MPRMMRITTLVFVCASIAGCSWGGSDDGGGGGGTGPDASVAAAPICGDSVCAASEVGSCTSDCGSGGGNTGPMIVCGNNSCETGETPQSCPNDCTGSGSGSGSGSGTLDCNDQATTFGCLLCTFGGTCAAPYDATSCAACGTGFPGGGTCNNDGICDQAEITDFTCADCM
jgi:hypothetical protein